MPPDYPAVYWNTANWKRGMGLPQCVVTAAAHPVGFGVRLTLPPRLEVSIWAKGNSTLLKTFERFVESVLMHELTHYRQRTAGKTNKWVDRKTGSAEEYLDTYYLNPLELEAHAAHIAYELATLAPAGPPPPPPPTEADVLATPIGNKVWGRIGPLNGTNRDQDLRSFIDDLVVEVQAHFAAFV